MINITNEDCMELMKRYPEKYFQLACVDPPYGGSINHWSYNGVLEKQRKVEHIPHRYTDKVNPLRTRGVKYSRNRVMKWDIAPPKEYFDELFRVSKYQIIWGGNYFDLPPSRNFIIWDKVTITENFSMAMAEYAWTNIPGNANIFRMNPHDKERFHPTQKPVALYKWLLSRYAKEGWKILDTHLGSGSIAIACCELGFDLTGCEIDAGYYEKAMERLNGHKKQLTLQYKQGEFGL